MSSSRRPLVAGNWKMNGDLSLLMSMEQVFENVSLENIDVLICPPFTLLSSFTDENIFIGGQTISEHASGAHTGEVSGQMLKAVGCDFAIVGHSERRADQHESNGLVADKVAQALEENITPVFCIGEPESVRDAGDLFEFLAAQLDAVISKVGIEAFAKIVIAYEPVWAIGTGKTATPEQAQEVHAFIRKHLAGLNSDVADNIKILYGGSVKADNASELFSQPDVDGGLIGGASLDPPGFLSICQSANAL